MNKMLVVVFNSEQQAYEGFRALKELHTEGSISLFAEALISKDSSGQPSIKEGADQSTGMGMALGLVTGSLIGLLGGPVGVVIGAGAGAAGGSVYDIANAGIGADFLQETAKQLEPGKAAVVAEVQEEWVLPVDTRMEALGGTVFRRARGEVVDANIERDAVAIKAELDAEQAEYERASGEAKAKLQAKINATKAELRAVQARAQASVEAAQREADAKANSLREQAAKAHSGQKQEIEKRTAEVQADYEKRTAKLKKAWDLTKEAFSG
jgi:uncharacterized membrane protein